jgi:hypothetical protein
MIAQVQADMRALQLQVEAYQAEQQTPFTTGLSTQEHHTLSELTQQLETLTSRRDEVLAQHQEVS